MGFKLIVSTPYAALSITLQALHRIHGMGVTHGDIRGENLLVTKQDGDWQVGDHIRARQAAHYASLDAVVYDQ